MDSATIATIATIAGILVVAALAQAATGFGFSLLSVPLLGVVVGPVEAVVGSSMVALLLNVAIVVRDHAAVQWRTARTVLVAGVAGLPVGLVLLRLLPPRLLSVLIAVVVMTGAVAIWWGLRIGPGRISVAGAGAMSGVLTTATGINGPPLAAAFSAMDLRPRQFRATLAAVFVIVGLVGVGGFAVTDHVSRLSLTVVLVGIPSVAIGWCAGDALFERITSEVVFRRVVLCALAVASTTTLAQAWMG